MERYFSASVVDATFKLQTTLNDVITTADSKYILPAESSLCARKMARTEYAMSPMLTALLATLKIDKDDKWYMKVNIFKRTRESSKTTKYCGSARVAPAMLATLVLLFNEDAIGLSCHSYVHGSCGGRWLAWRSERLTSHAVFGCSFGPRVGFERGIAASRFASTSSSYAAEVLRAISVQS